MYLLTGAFHKCFQHIFHRAGIKEKKNNVMNVSKQWIYTDVRVKQPSHQCNLTLIACTQKLLYTPDW